MSIDATIIGVTYLSDGTAKLMLEQSDSSRCAGQNSLIVLNPPKDMSGIIGCNIWGSSDSILFGDKKIAKRIGYSRIELVSK